MGRLHGGGRSDRFEKRRGRAHGGGSKGPKCGILRGVSSEAGMPGLSVVGVERVFLRKKGGVLSV